MTRGLDVYSLRGDVQAGPSPSKLATVIVTVYLLLSRPPHLCKL